MRGEGGKKGREGGGDGKKGGRERERQQGKKSYIQISQHDLHDLACLHTRQWANQFGCHSTPQTHRHNYPYIRHSHTTKGSSG